MADQTRILIAGAGAIGQMLGARLAQADHDVTLLVRPRVRDAVAAGLRVRGHTTFDGPLACITGPGGSEGAFDAVFVTCKAHATAAMAPIVAPLVAPGGVVSSLQNGLGNGEALAAAVPPRRLALAITSQGVTVEGPGRVHHAGTGPTRVGPYRADEAAEGDAPAAGMDEAALAHTLLQDARLDPSWHDPILPHVWAKAIVNAGINPVGALHGRTNGQLLADDALRRQVLALVDEAVATAGAAGIALPPGDLRHAALDTLEATAENRCSMLQDVAAGRRTEIHQITGHIVRLADRHGVAVPESRRVLAGVAALAPPPQGRSGGGD